MSASPYEPLAAMAQALSSPKRLRAMNFLCQEPKSVEALAALLGESVANTAAHLKPLKAAGLVTAERHGKYVLHEVRDPAALALFMALREAGEALSPALRLARTQSEDVSAVTMDALSAVASERGVTVVDLRPESEYRAGHLPRARSMPLESLDAQLAGLPRRGRLLAYCRGAYCAKAREGVSRMRAAGLRAERLDFGVPEWRAAGLPLEREE